MTALGGGIGGRGGEGYARPFERGGVEATTGEEVVCNKEGGVAGGVEEVRGDAEGEEVRGDVEGEAVAVGGVAGVVRGTRVEDLEADLLPQVLYLGFALLARGLIGGETGFSGSKDLFCSSSLHTHTDIELRTWCTRSSSILSHNSILKLSLIHI